jgi:hypothetical protein
MTKEQVMEWAKQTVIKEWSGTDSPEFIDGLVELCQLAREDMREECAKACKKIENDYWLRFKGMSDDRANPHIEGISDGATLCAQAIRNLEV